MSDDAAGETVAMDVDPLENGDGALVRVREEVEREAAQAGADFKVTALRLLDREQKSSEALKQERALLAARLEKLQRENNDLKGRVASSPDGSVQGVIDKQLLHARLSLRDKDQAKQVVDMIRQMHSLGVDVRRLGLSPNVETQLVEAKRNLNRAVRCLLLETTSDPSQCILEVIKYTDSREYKEGAEPVLQVRPR
jgi:hypothetical protein